jgi:hypothetical protein
MIPYLRKCSVKSTTRVSPCQLKEVLAAEKVEFSHSNILSEDFDSQIYSMVIKVELKVLWNL